MEDDNVGSSCCMDPRSASTTTTPHLKVYQGFVLATPILITFVLLFLFLLICLRRQCLLADHSSQYPTTTTTTTTSSFMSWFIPSTLFAVPRRGLKKSIRDGLPIIIYNEKLTTSSSSSTSTSTVLDNQSCVVCLGDYQKNETLQQLPVCSHIFHKDCVDEWFANNSTCPLCRSLLLFPPHNNTTKSSSLPPSSRLQPPSTTTTTTTT